MISWIHSDNLSPIHPVPACRQIPTRRKAAYQSVTEAALRKRVFSQGTVCPKQNSSVTSSVGEKRRRNSTIILCPFMNIIGYQKRLMMLLNTQLLSKYVFSAFLKEFKHDLLRMSSGSSFHCLAADIVNEFS